MKVLSFCRFLVALSTLEFEASSEQLRIMQHPTRFVLDGFSFFTCSCKLGELYQRRRSWFQTLTS